MKYERASGILLHPTCLPGPYGIGDIGPQAQSWLEFLSNSGCGLWQILPLGPTGYGDSPYQCFSAFAGNPYMISPEALVQDGLLSASDLDDLPEFSEDQVDFGQVISWKLSILDRAFSHFERSTSPTIRRDHAIFHDKHKDWLEDFALFMALKEAHGGASWTMWEPSLRERQPEALASARHKSGEAIRRQAFRQFIFFRQWDALHAHASQLGIKIIGDIPIFVAHDSSDVWSNPELFYLDKNGNPSVVAGVPPDYFSPTGQRWGNPLYRWRVHKADGYTWWLKRIHATLVMVDIVRLDHFRGFAAYWEVPGRAKTAEKGRWVRAPGKHFFQALQDDLGVLPVIAEDLGVITPDVDALRVRFSLPGMKILQFSFAGDPQDPFLPHNYPRNCVVYTGTHDNDTARGWYERVPEGERDFYRRYLDRSGENIAWDLIRACWSSVAVWALAPMQDFLNLGNEARMNYPGNPSGNWTWRMPAEGLNEELQERIKEINTLYGRSNTCNSQDQS
jgi:4-alpha-glucanotransferase